jgi:hypothetical protein
MDRKTCVDGAIFVLVYNVTSRSSLDRIVNYSNEVLRLDGCRDASKLIVALHPNTIHGNKIIDEGKEFASRIGGQFVEVEVEDVVGMNSAFQDLVRAHMSCLSMQQAKEKKGSATKKTKRSPGSILTGLRAKRDMNKGLMEPTSAHTTSITTQPREKLRALLHSRKVLDRFPPPTMRVEKVVRNMSSSKSLDLSAADHSLDSWISQEESEEAYHAFGPSISWPEKSASIPRGGR